MGIIGGTAAARLHLTVSTLGEVVSRPARHGDRDGHHGLRRRRVVAGYLNVFFMDRFGSRRR
jgi:hypothetical protein